MFKKSERLKKTKRSTGNTETVLKMVKIRKGNWNILPFGEFYVNFVTLFLTLSYFIADIYLKKRQKKFITKNVLAFSSLTQVCIWHYINLYPRNMQYVVNLTGNLPNGPGSGSCLRVRSSVFPVRCSHWLILNWKFSKKSNITTKKLISFA